MKIRSVLCITLADITASLADKNQLFDTLQLVGAID
jgi:hypothetical protein